MVRLLKGKKKLVSNWWEIWWEFMTDFRWDETRIRWGRDEKGCKMDVDNVNNVNRIEKCSLVNVDREKCSCQCWQHLSWPSVWPKYVQRSTLTSRKVQWLTLTNRKEQYDLRGPRKELFGQRSTSTAAFFLVNSRQPFSSCPQMALKFLRREIYQLFSGKNDSVNKFML